MTTENTSTNKTSEFPAFDFTHLLKSFEVPGVDFGALLEREKKNIEALTKANKIAFEGWQALVRRQTDIFQEEMKQAVADAQKEDVKARADLAREAFERALANMKELAEMAANSQKQAFEVMRERFEENISSMNPPKRGG